MAHVMVLDDEPGICWAFRQFLGDEGHRVTVASTAEQGLDRASADPPDVLFLASLGGIPGVTKGFLGTLDENGRAEGFILLPADFPTGVRLFISAVAFPAGGIETANTLGATTN